MLLTLPFFTGCNGSEIADLEARLAAAESKIHTEEARSVTALEALEEGKCTISDADENSATLVCGDGSSFTIVNGTDGLDGQDGTNGANGDSCVVTEVEGKGALVACGETVVMIYNGQDGSNGEDGANGQDGVSAVVETINPCGSQGRFDEVILRLSDGSLLAHYASGNKQFLTFLGPGHYRTTDGFACRFSVDEDLNVSW